MKKIISTVGILLVLTSAIYYLRGVDLESVISDIKQQRVYIQRNDGSSFMPDWKTEDLLDEINLARTDAGYSRIETNAKLDKAAKARLSVVLSENDVDGSVTGVTREKALQTVGYDANLIGDLVLLGFFKTNDPISFWKSNKINSDTLLHPDFKEVGIAIKNSNERVDVYVILVAPRKIVRAPVAPKIVWGGPDLWAVVNKRRVENGVNPLNQKDELCTIASIRLNELLELGKLDGHAGFVPVLERPDLKWISSKYNISEFLIQGYQTPAEAVTAWENTLGHRKLITGGEYVWGCVYAQNTFGVAITAY